MNLYQICVPTKSNNLAITYEDEREAFEASLLVVVGGYTFLGTRRGVWRDPETRQCYNETMHWYEFAVDSDRKRDLIIAKAFQYFPDQLSISVSEIGRADIVSRPEPVTDASPVLEAAQ